MTDILEYKSKKDIGKLRNKVNALNEFINEMLESQKIRALQHRDTERVIKHLGQKLFRTNSLNLFDYTSEVNYHLDQAIRHQSVSSIAFHIDTATEKYEAIFKSIRVCLNPDISPSVRGPWFRNKGETENNDRTIDYENLLKSYKKELRELEGRIEKGENYIKTAKLSHDKQDDAANKLFGLQAKRGALARQIDNLETKLNRVKKDKKTHRSYSV